MFNDSGPPLLSWVPADGTETDQSAIDVEGTASDDAGIDSVTVNGALVSITPTINPNEVEFSTSVSLVEGINSITVTATDISERETSQTHEVTRVVNTDPTVSIGADETINEGDAFARNGSFTDPDADTWT